MSPSLSAQMEGIGAFMLLMLAAAAFLLILVFVVVVSLVRSNTPAERKRRSAAATTDGWAAGVCPTCGYDVRATPDRCPECGTAAPPKEET